MYDVCIQYTLYIIYIHAGTGTNVNLFKCNIYTFTCTKDLSLENAIFNLLSVVSSISCTYCILKRSWMTLIVHCTLLHATLYMHLSNNDEKYSHSQAY